MLSLELYSLDAEVSLQSKVDRNDQDNLEWSFHSAMENIYIRWADRLPQAAPHLLCPDRTTSYHLRHKGDVIVEFRHTQALHVEAGSGSGNGSRRASKEEDAT